MAIKTVKTVNKPASPQKPVSPKKTTKSVEFVLFAPEAKEVYLVGEFNNWDPTGYQMRRFKEGICKKSVQLQPGRYEYMFLVDGNWWTDPENKDRQPNAFGTENSVITVS